MRKTILFFTICLTLLLAGCLVYPTHGSLSVSYPPGAVVYYSNPPFYPGYGYQYWYTLPAQPGFVFFFSNKGKHHRHKWDGHSRGGGRGRR